MSQQRPAISETAGSLPGFLLFLPASSLPRRYPNVSAITRGCFREAAWDGPRHSGLRQYFRLRTIRGSVDSDVKTASGRPLLHRPPTAIRDRIAAQNGGLSSGIRSSFLLPNSVSDRGPRLVVERRVFTKLSFAHLLRQLFGSIRGHRETVPEAPFHFSSSYSSWNSVPLPMGSRCPSTNRRRRAVSQDFYPPVRIQDRPTVLDAL